MTPAFSVSFLSRHETSCGILEVPYGASLRERIRPKNVQKEHFQRPLWHFDSPKGNFRPMAAVSFRASSMTKKAGIREVMGKNGTDVPRFPKEIQ